MDTKKNGSIKISSSDDDYDPIPDFHRVDDETTITAADQGNFDHHYALDEETQLIQEANKPVDEIIDKEEYDEFKSSYMSRIRVKVGSNSEEDGSERVEGSVFSKALIRIGPSYQADIPPLVVEKTSHNSSPPEYTVPRATTMFKPKKISDQQLDNYLSKVKTLSDNYYRINNRSEKIIYGKDIEGAERILYECNYDVPMALERMEAHYKNAQVTYYTEKWTDSEINIFEISLSIVGKRFHLIKEQLENKTVAEIVEFYYFWKHSFRRILFDDFTAQQVIKDRAVTDQSDIFNSFSRDLSVACSIYGIAGQNMMDL